MGFAKAQGAHGEPFAIVLMILGFFVMLAWMGSAAGPFGSGGTCQTNAGVCFTDAFNIALPTLGIMFLLLGMLFMTEMGRDLADSTRGGRRR